MILTYTILIPSTLKRFSQLEIFSISFSNSNAPKDIWDHLDAVEDYLIDFWGNPFDPIPEFEIVSYNTTTINNQQPTGEQQ